MNPNNVTTYVGQNVSFTCISAILHGVANYTWLFDHTHLLPGNTVISRGPDGGSVLAISQVSLLNRGRYTCSGNSPALSAGVDAILEVTGIQSSLYIANIMVVH